MFSLSRRETETFVVQPIESPYALLPSPSPGPVSPRENGGDFLWVKNVTQFAIIPIAVVKDPAIGPHALRLALLLSSYAREDGWCWPKLATLGATLGIGKSATHEHLASLVAAGYLQKERRTLPDGMEVTAYRLLYDRKLPGRSATPNGRSARPDTGVRPHRTMEVTTTESNKGARGDLALEGPSPAPTWLGNRVIVVTNRYEDAPLDTTSDLC